MRRFHFPRSETSAFYVGLAERELLSTGHMSENLFAGICSSGSGYKDGEMSSIRAREAKLQYNLLVTLKLMV
jgi:hypothetical protein